MPSYSQVVKQNATPGSGLEWACRPRQKIDQSWPDQHGQPDHSASDWDDTRNFNKNVDWTWANSWAIPGVTKKPQNYYPQLKATQPYENQSSSTRVTHGQRLGTSAAPNAKVKRRHRKKSYKTGTGAGTSHSSSQPSGNAAGSNNVVQTHVAVPAAESASQPESSSQPNSSSEASGDAASGNSEVQTHITVPAAESSPQPESNPLPNYTFVNVPQPNPEPDYTFASAPLPTIATGPFVPDPNAWKKNRACDTDGKASQPVTKGHPAQFTIGVPSSAILSARFHARQHQLRSTGVVRRNICPEDRRNTPALDELLVEDRFYDVKIQILKEVCVLWHCPITISLFFRIPTYFTHGGIDEPSFQLTKVNHKLHEEKSYLNKLFLSNNTFNIDVRKLLCTGKETKKWPKQRCDASAEECKSGNCSFTNRKRGQTVCMRKPLALVNSLYLSDRTGNVFHPNLVFGVLKHFKNLKTIGFDLRGLTVRSKEYETSWYEFDAPAYFVAALEAAYKHYNENKEMPKSARVRIAAEDIESASLYMTGDGLVAGIAQHWNEKCVPMNEEEKYLFDLNNVGTNDSTMLVVGGDDGELYEF